MTNYIGQATEFVTGVCATMLIGAFFFFVWLFRGEDSLSNVDGDDL